jgi:hypothetical protein
MGCSVRQRPLSMPSQEQREQVSTEHQDSSESDNHQRDVVEFPRAVGAAIEDNRNDESEHATRERDARFGQAHTKNRGPRRRRVAAGAQALIILLNQSSVNAIDRGN